MTLEILDKSIKILKGVGDKRACALLRLGIKTIGDVLNFFPRGYEDRSKVIPIFDAVHGENVCIKATVISDVKCNYIRKNMVIYSVKVSDGFLSMNMVWFNNRFINDMLKTGEEYLFYGKFEQFPKRQMVSPIFEKPGAGKLLGRIVPIYPLTAGITQKVISDLVFQAIEITKGSMEEILSDSIRKEEKLCEINYAISRIHFPENDEAKEIARKRLVFEEFFIMQTALLMIKSEQKEKKTTPILDAACVDEFVNSLSFELTNDQKSALSDILGDMKKSVPMSRLVQGDVGSGKTVLAAGAMFVAIKNGMQAALMAPTEILARQHFESIAPIFEKFNIKTALVLGSLSQKAKKELAKKIYDGEIDAIIGTHALFSDYLTYKNLGLVITDEQHRFGVNQRKVLLDKGLNPHSLIMTATPIPRSLALILYCDMDISQIKELPPGRKPVKTYALGENMRERIYNFVRKRVSLGEQVYIVCPLVDENEESELKSVTQYAAKLKNEIFRELKTEFVHGKMKPAEKDAVMSAFLKGDIDILVATSVIEVGVNVTNATVMIIENAERFGLSQLHQLRGRVGRGEKDAFCILFPNSKSEETKKRMEVICSTSDGFKISEEDLLIRGPGDFFGTMQHGIIPLKIANIFEDISVLKQTSVLARKILQEDPSLSDSKNSGIRKKVFSLFDNNITFS